MTNKSSLNYIIRCPHLKKKAKRGWIWYTAIWYDKFILVNLDEIHKELKYNHSTYPGTKGLTVHPIAHTYSWWLKIRNGTLQYVTYITKQRIYTYSHTMWLTHTTMWFTHTVILKFQQGTNKKTLVKRGTHKLPSKIYGMKKKHNKNNICMMFV